MNSRWIMAFSMAIALAAPRLALASDTSYDKQVVEQNQGSSGAGSGEMAGMHGMRGTHKGMMGEMDCAGILAKSDVTVEDTPQGAVVRFKAKGPTDATRIRRMAHNMESCMGSSTTGSESKQK